MQVGGGIFLAVGLLGGAIVGTLLGQPSKGLVFGLAVGIACAVALSLWDARRR